MKNTTATLAFFLLILVCQFATAQQSILYSLENDFDANQSGYPSLIPLANGSGQTGSFQSVAQPSNFCPIGGDMMAYHFEDNAGLRFDNSSGFLGCEYTIEMLFKYDNLPSLFSSPWVSVLSFQPNADNGLFFEFNPLFGTYIEIWEGNSEYQSCSYSGFNINDWQKLSFTRNCDGAVNVYFGCQLYCSFNDSNAQLFLPGNDLIFFQDDPSVLSGEAQPGFVRNIRLTNYALTPTEVTTCCDNICNDLSGSCLVETNVNNNSCDIAETGIDSVFIETATCDSLVITTTTLLPSDITYLTEVTCYEDEVGENMKILLNHYGCDSTIITNTIFESAPTIFNNFTTCVIEDTFTDTIQYDCDSIVVTTIAFEEPPTFEYNFNTCLMEDAGIDTLQYECDSIVITTTTFEDVPLFEYNFPTCFLEDAFADTVQYDCDSIVIINTSFVGIDTIILDEITTSAGSTVLIFGNPVSEPGYYCQTLTSSLGCDSTSCISLQWITATSEPIEPGGLYVPNAFSPNNDGLNDRLTVYAGDRVKKIRQFQVFNTQGKLLYRRSDFFPNEEVNGWDGTFRGKEISVGVYVFAVEAETVSGTLIQRSGSCTLLR